MPLSLCHSYQKTNKVIFFRRSQRGALTLAPLVDQQRRWLSVSRFDPGWKEASLVCLIPQVLVEVSISDLLQRFHVVHWHQVAIQVHELNTHLENGKGSVQAEMGGSGCEEHVKAVTLKASLRNSSLRILINI